MLTEEREREIAEVPVVHHGREPLNDHYYYPITHNQTRDLLGRLLTQLDAMGLADRAHRAAKTLIVQEVWRWWNEACDNATTSSEGCLAPVVVANLSKDDITAGRALSNRWGWASEREWLEHSRRGALVTS